MNQRIKELASQCWDLRLDGRHFDQEQFAELIIAECCVTADANIDDSKYPSYWIKRKFGVKE